MLQLAKDRGEQELTDLEPFIRPVPQLDHLENSLRLVGEASESGAARRPHHRDVVSEAPHLVLHELAVFGAEPVAVAVEEVPKLDVIEARVISLGPRGKINAHRAVGRAAKARSEHE